MHHLCPFVFFLKNGAGACSLTINLNEEFIWEILFIGVSAPLYLRIINEHVNCLSIDNFLNIYLMCF